MTRLRNETSNWSGSLEIRAIPECQLHCRRPHARVTAKRDLILHGAALEAFSSFQNLRQSTLNNHLLL